MLDQRDIGGGNHTREQHRVDDNEDKIKREAETSFCGQWVKFKHETM